MTQAKPKYKYLNEPRNGLSHRQREERRKEISIYSSLNPDLDTAQIAQSFNVGAATVRRALNEYKIEPLVYKQLRFSWFDDPYSTQYQHTGAAQSPSNQSYRQLYFAWYCCDQLPEKSLNIVYDLLEQNTGADLADKYQVSRQRINQIKQSAINKGVVFPKKCMPIKKCAVCGLEYEGFNQTCGQECLSKLRSKLRHQKWLDKAKNKDLKWSRLIHHTYKCIGCGSEFQRSNYLVSIAQAAGVAHPKYCSRKCYIHHGLNNNSANK